jgi:hypothetical protein
MLATNPMLLSPFSKFLDSKSVTENFSPPTLPPFTFTKSLNYCDPFSGLPYDITYFILLLLPSSSVLAMRKASYHIYASFPTSQQSFWCIAIYSSMPWLWEIHDWLKPNGQLDERQVDYMGLFLWLDKISTPQEHVDKPFTGLANRRRIWGVCSQLADHYLALVREKAAEHAVDATAAHIWNTLVNLDLPVVLWPKPKHGTCMRTATAQWSCDLTLFSSRALFTVYWNHKHILAGMGHTHAGNTNVFWGKVGESSDTIEVKSPIIGFVLHMPDIFFHGNSDTAIKGITVSFNN